MALTPDEDRRDACRGSLRKRIALVLLVVFVNLCVVTYLRGAQIARERAAITPPAKVAILYVHGVEVAREVLPPGSGSPSTPASSEMRVELRDVPPRTFVPPNEWTADEWRATLLLGR